MQFNSLCGAYKVGRKKKKAKTTVKGERPALTQSLYNTEKAIKYAFNIIHDAQHTHTHIYAYTYILFKSRKPDSKISNTKRT